MTVSELRQRLEQIDGTFTLAADALGVGHVETLFETYLPSATLNVEEAHADVDRLSVDGRMTVGSAKGASVQVAFLTDAAAAEVSGIRMTLSLAGWTMESEGIRFAVEAAGEVLHDPEVTLQAGGNDGALAGPTALLGGSVRIRTREGIEKTITLLASLPPAKSDRDPPALELAVDLDADRDPVTLGDLAVLTQLVPGGRFDVIPADIPVADALSLSRLALLVDPVDNAVLLLRVEVQSVKPLVIRENVFEIDRFTFSFTVQMPTVAPQVYAVAAATMMLGGRPVNVALSLPDLYLTGGLSPDEPIPLKPFLSHFFDAGFLPDDFELSGFRFGLNLKAPHDYRFDIELDNLWSLSLTDSAKLEFRHLSVDVAAAGATATPDVSVQSRWALGDASLYLSAEEESGAWTFRGGTVAGSVGDEPISLTKLVQDVLDLFGLPTLPPTVPDVQLSRLRLSFGTGDVPFHIRAELAVPCQVPFGKKLHDAWGRVDFRVEKDGETGKRAFSGTFEADLMIGDVRFAVGYEMGKDTHIFQGAAASDGAIRLPDLADALDIPIAGLDVPERAGVALTGAAFRYHHEEHTLSLVADTDVGRAFLAAGKPDPEGSWGLVFGVEVEGDGLPALLSPGDELRNAPLATTLRLRELVLTVATQDWTDVRLPALPERSGGSGTSGETAGTTLLDTLSTRTMSFSRGISAQGILDLEQSASGDTRLQHLQGLLGDPNAQLVASCTLSPSKVELEVRLDGGLVLTGASPARPDTPGALALAGAGILLQLRPQMKVEAYGKALIPVYDTTLQATGRAVLTTRDAHCEFALSAVGDGSSAGMTLPGLPGLHIDEVGVEVGLTFTPPGLELGLEAGFSLGTQEKGANQLALLLALEGELPDPLLLYARFDELSADRLMEVVGRDPTTLPAAVRQVRAEDLMIYYAQMDLELPDGRQIKPGFGVHGLVVIGGFRAFARLDVSEESGITGLAEVAPLSLAGGAVRLSGNGAGVTRPEVSVDGKSRPAGAPRLKSDNEGSEPETRVVVPPGGAVVAFSSQHEPYVNVSLQLTLLDAIGTDLEVEVKDQAFHLLLETRLGDAGHVRLACDVGRDSFSASADVELDLYGTIGPVRIGDITIPELVLDLVVAGRLSVVAKGEKLEFEIAGRLAFDGLSAELAPVTITADIKSLEELPRRMLEEIGRDAARFLPDLVDEAGRAVDELGTEIQAFLDELAGHRTYAARRGVAIRDALPKEAEEVFAMAVEDPAVLAEKAQQIRGQARELREAAEQQAGAIRATTNARVEAILARAAAVREAAGLEATRIFVAAAREAELHAERVTARRAEAEECCSRHSRTGMEQAAHLRRLAAAAAARHREAGVSAAAALKEHAGRLREQAESRRPPAGLGHHGEPPAGPVIVTTPGAGAR